MNDQKSESMLMVEKAMLSLTMLPDNSCIEEIIDRVLDEAFWMARSSEIWSELFFGSQEVKTRVQQKMKEDQLKSIIEGKRLIALELKMKCKLAKIEREKCSDIVKRLAQGLVMEVMDRSVEQAEYREDIGMVDIVQQEEVLLALRNLWIVEDMEVVIDGFEKGGCDQEMLDLTTISEVQIPMDLDHEGDMEGSNQDTVKDVRMDACDFDGEILKCKSPNFPPNKQITNLYVQNLESLGKYFDNQLVAISLVGIKSSIYTRKRSWSGSGGWLSWRGTTPGARTMARGRRRIS